MQQEYIPGQTYGFRFNQLVRSAKYNVRSKSERTSEKYIAGLHELGALILAQGLLQNLIGFVQINAKKKRTGLIEIVGGGRRLDSIELLVASGKLDPESIVIQVKICTEADAIIKSLTENSGREALPAADQFRAFKILADAGKSTDEIATSFGVDSVTIKRRLKLANVSPRLFQLYEEGTATLDQLMALALTEDHDTQEKVWDSMPDYNRTHHRIRQLITAQEIDTKNSRVAKFVGLDEYEAAGGEVRRDLFSDNNDGFMKDAVLLESLAVEKLKRLTPELAGQSWAWIDYCTSISYDDMNKFQRVSAERAPLSAEDQAKYDELERQWDELEAKLDALWAKSDEENADEEAVENEMAPLREEQSRIEDQQEQLKESYPMAMPAEAAKLAGVVVTIDHAGQVQIHTGLIRPEDKKDFQQAENVRKAQAGEYVAPPKVKAVHSEKLVKQLTAHRTAALQVLVAQQVNVGLVVTAHCLASQTFEFGRCYKNKHGAAQISLTSTDLSNEGEDVAKGIALEQFGEMYRAWEDKMPAKLDGLFDWLMQQDQETVIALIAYCTAHSLNTIQWRDEAPSNDARQLAQAVKLDMADWWEPTRESYFAQVSKPQILKVVAENVSAQAADAMTDLKKIPLAEAAEQSLRGKRWVPPIMRNEVPTAPATDEQTDAEQGDE